MEPDNICIIKHVYEKGDTVNWCPALALRSSYQIVEVISTYETLEQAASAGRELSKRLGLPLVVSSAYYGRPEVTDLKMM